MEFDRMMERAAGLLEDLGAEQWEILGLTSQGLNLAVRGEEIDKFVQSSTSGAAFRVIEAGKLGFAFSLGAGEDGLAAAAAEALASARSSDLVQEAGFASPPGPLPTPQVFDPLLASEPLESKQERVLRMARLAREADPRVKNVYPASLSEAATTLRLVNSLGVDLEFVGTTVSAGAQVLASDGDEAEMGWEGQAGRFWSDIDSDALGRKAGQEAAAMLGGRPVSDGRYDLVLDPRVAVEFLELLGASLAGDNLVKGRSFLAGKEGQAVASPVVSIIDDGLYPRGLGTGAFDAEGEPQVRKVLVNQGRLEGFVFDRLWGWRAGRASTGNASRDSLKAPVGVDFTNLHLAPGQGTLEDLLADLGRGLYITEVMGGHTADPVSGAFSVGAAGYLVEGGGLSRPVKSIAIAGKVQELWQAVARVGGEVRFLGKTGSPPLVVEGISVSGP